MEASRVPAHGTGETIARAAKKQIRIEGPAANDMLQKLRLVHGGARKPVTLIDTGSTCIWRTYAKQLALLWNCVRRGP